MKRSIVEDYIASEEEKADKILSDILKPNSEISAKDLYPEYNLDKVHTTSLEPYSKIWAQLPFSNKLVVHIITSGPSDPDEFRKWYGVSVEELLRLENDKKIVLMGSLSHEPTDIPDYLDAILYKGFPTSIRLRKFTDLIINKRADKKDIDNKISMLAKRFPYSVDGLGKVIRESKTRIYATTRFTCYQLLSFGYDKQFNDVVGLSLTNPENSVKLLELYRLFLIGSFYYSLDGVHTVSSDAVFKNDLGNGNGILKGKNDTKIFSSEVASVLVDELALYRPRNLGDALDIYPDYGKAVNALADLDEYIKKGKNVHEITEIGIEIKKLFNEVLSMYESRDKFDKIIQVLCIGGSAAAGLLSSGSLGVLAGIGISISGSPYIARPLSNNIAKIGKLSTVISLFDFKESVDTWKKSLGKRT